MSSTNPIDDTNPVAPAEIASAVVAPVDTPAKAFAPASNPGPAPDTTAAPVTEPSKEDEPYAAALEAIGVKLKEQGLNQDEIDTHLVSLSFIAKKYGISDQKELMSSYIQEISYEVSSDDFKGNFEKIFESLVAKPPENGAIQNSVDQHILDAKAKSKAEFQAKAQPSEGNIQPIKPQQEGMQMMQSSIAGDLARGLGSMVSSIIGRKNEGPGKSFTDLQQGGNGLGMNNPNLDPNLLANTSLDRLDQSVRALSGLSKTDDPSIIEKAKAGVMDAATDAQKYMGNENRSLLSSMAEGKTNQFEAGDKMEDRSKRFESAMNKASTAEVSVEDEDFKKRLKETTEKAMEAIKQMMESLKEMAGKLLGMGNDEPAKKTGPSVGPR